MMSDSHPRVSVIIAAYNYAGFLHETLECLRAQTETDWEAIVVDDGSTDNTAKVMADHMKDDPRIQYLRQENQGPSAARNRGLERARGDYIQFLDADDFLESGKLHQQAEYLRRHPEVDLVYGGMKFFQTDGADPKLYLHWADGPVQPPPATLRLTLPDLLPHNTIPINAPLFRRSLAEYLSGFDESLRGVEDWDFWLRGLLADRRYDCVEECGVDALVRTHAGSSSRNKVMMYESTLKVRRKLEGLLPSEDLKRVNRRQQEEETAALLRQRGLAGDWGRASLHLLLHAIRRRKLRWALHAALLPIAGFPALPSFTRALDAVANKTTSRYVVEVTAKSPCWIRNALLPLNHSFASHSSLKLLRMALFVLLASGNALDPPSARAHATEFTARSGDVVADLRAPAEGISAGEETAFAILVMRAPRPDPNNKNALPFLFGPGLPCKSVSCAITMPAMAGMPQIAPALTAHGTVGVYDFTATFLHGGRYRFDFTATPSDGSAPIALRYDVAVGDALDPAAAPYRLVVDAVPAHPAAGKPVRMTLSVVDNRSGKSVTQFETVHEKKMHFIMVRDDLGAFAHEHPVPQSDGTFTHTTTFPIAGTWRLYGDCAPVNAGAQVAIASIDVAGPAPPPFVLTAPPPPASQDAPLTTARDANVRIALSAPLLAARQDANLIVSLTNSQGKPITNTEPWLGAPAHMVLISQHSRAFVHSHPADWAGDDKAHGLLRFVLRLPEAGLYRGWLQFQRAGVLHTIPFTLSVAPHPI